MSEFPYPNWDLSESTYIGCRAPSGLFPLLSPRMWKARPSFCRKEIGRTRLRRNTRYRILSQTALPGHTTAGQIDSSFNNNSYPTTLLHLHCSYKKPTQLEDLHLITGFCLCSGFPTICSAEVRAIFKNTKQVISLYCLNSSEGLPLPLHCRIELKIPTLATRPSRVCAFLSLFYHLPCAHSTRAKPAFPTVPLSHARLLLSGPSCWLNPLPRHSMACPFHQASLQNGLTPNDCVSHLSPSTSLSHFIFFHRIYH